MLLIDIVAVSFLLAALIAIAARFLPRETFSGLRVPAIIDRSIGMWLLRRAIGRWQPSEPDEPRGPVEPTLDEIAYRIGVPGAPTPTPPARFDVSRAGPQAHPIPPVTPVAVRPVVGGRPQARPNALGLQRRLAGGIAIAVVVVAVGMIASTPRPLDGEVLSATGTPGASQIAFAITDEPTAEPSAAPTEPPPPTDDLASPPPAAQATPPPVAAATPRPTARPAPAPTRTPPPAPKPTLPPARTPTPPPPTPVPPTPTPAPTPVPPNAVVDPVSACGPAPFTVTFTGEDLAHSVGNKFTWRIDGAVVPGSGSTLTQTFAPKASEYIVRLTISNSAGADSVQVPVYVPCP